MVVYKKIFLSIFLVSLAFLGIAQEQQSYRFTLEDCLRFAMANSYERKSMELTGNVPATLIAGSVSSTIVANESTITGSLLSVCSVALVMNGSNAAAIRNII